MIPKWVINFVDAIRGLMRFPPVVIDGTLYVSIAVLTSLQSSFAEEAATQFLGAPTLYWVQTTCKAMLASALALKMFRSTSYSDHVKPKEPTGNTEIFTKPKDG